MRLLYIGLMLFVAACSLKPSDEREFDAQKEFDKLDAPDVPTVQASLERGALQALEDGKYEQAAGLYKQLIDQDSTVIRYKLGLAHSLRRLNEHDAAIEFYDEVIRKHPGHLDANEGKALSLMAGGDVEKSAKLLKWIVQRDRSRWQTHNALGILFAIKKKPSEARAYFKEALKYSPNNPSVLNNVGLIEAMQRRFREASKQLDLAARKAEGIQKKQIELNHALVLGISGNMAAAKELASEHLSQSALTNNMGLYAYLANNNKLAKSYLNMALTGNPTYYERAWKNLDIIAKEGN